MATKIITKDDWINKRTRNVGPLHVRFWRRVNKRGPKMPHMPTRCWVWTGAITGGYGNMGVGQKSMLSHRVRWIIEHGDIPAGQCVLHRCDNRACVRLAHLFLGTNADNMADMYSKGRGRKAIGENHPSAKVTDAQVSEIIAKRNTGDYTLKMLAEEYFLSISTVHKLVTVGRSKGDGRARRKAVARLEDRSDTVDAEIVDRGDD